MTPAPEVLSGVVHPWHLDAFGHMNARWYAHILDDASFQFWARLGLSQKSMVAAHGAHTVTATVTTDFLKEIVAGDCYVVTGKVKRLGGKSVTLEFSLKLLPTGEDHATFTTVEVFVDAGDHRSIAIPEAIRENLRPMM